MNVSQDSQPFLSRLSATLIAASTAWEMMEIASEMLGDHLEGDHTLYAEIEGEEGSRVAHVRAQYVRRGSPLPSRVDYEAKVGGWMSESLRRGEPVIVTNMRTDPRLEESARAAYLASGTLAVMAVSLIRNSREVLNFGVQHCEPRNWTQSEVELLKEVAERTWAAAERARAEDALRETAENLRTSAEWSEAQSEAFRVALNGAPLETSLGYLVRWLSTNAGGKPRCAIYLENGQGGLSHVVGMNERYAQQMDGCEISMKSFSCGLAVASASPVITRDVLEEPRWQSRLALAREHGFRACWSYPLELGAGKFVGTLALYFAEPRVPTTRQQGLIDKLTRTAAIMVSRQRESEGRWRAETALKEIEERV